MKQIKLSIFILLQAVIVAGNLHAEQLSYMPNELIVKYKQNTSVSAAQFSIQKLGKQVAEIKKINGVQRVRFSEAVDIEKKVEQLKSNPSIEFAQPNYIYRKTAIPNDTSYGQLWGLKNTSQVVNGTSPSTNTAGLDIDAETAWDHVTDCSAVTVAVIDSGVNWGHVDLAANIWSNSDEAVDNNDTDGNGFDDDVRGWDFIDNDNDPDDDDGHGTHVAGTIAADGNNGAGITGVCWSAKIMPVRALDATGSGTSFGISQAIDYAAENGADIINMSLGGAGSGDLFMSQAIERAGQNDVVVIVAAGNDDSNNDSLSFYPCNYTHSNLICVAALEQDYDRASYSNYGVNSVDVGAPGTGILSTVAGTKTNIFEDDFSINQPAWVFVGGSWTTGLNQDPPFLPLEFYMSDPSGFDTSVSYSDNINQYAYVRLDLSAYDVKLIRFRADFRVSTGDFFRLQYDSTNNIPSITIAEVEDGNSSGLNYFEYQIPDICDSTCSIGFNLQSNNDGNASYGVDLERVTIGGLVKNDISYSYFQGTSMATPHAVGVAALVKAFHPQYTAIDIVNAVKFSGDDVASLSGITTTGKAVDAYKAITYINPPRSLSVNSNMPVVE